MADPLGALRDLYETHLKKYGTGLAGAAFGLGWWAFVDAAVVAPAGTKIAFTNVSINLIFTTYHSLIFMYI